MVNPNLKRALDQFDRQLNASAGELVTPDQLQRIMDITQTDDLEERNRRYNAVVADLEQQIAASTTNFHGVCQVLDNRQPSLSQEDTEVIRAANDRALAEISAQAAELMAKHQRQPASGSTTVPRSRRLAI